MVKIEAKKLKEFIRTATLAGKIESFILDFNNNGLSSNIIMEGNIGATINHLEKSSFKEFNIVPIKIGIKDSKLLLNILNGFNGIINLEVTSDILRISDDKKKAEILNMKTEFVEGNLPDETKEQLLNKFDGGVEINSEILFNSLKNASVLGVEQFRFICKDNKLSIEVGENNFNRITETISCDYKNFESNYDAILKDAIGVLNEKTKISVFGDFTPILFIKKTEDSIHKIMISPLSD